MTPVESLLPTLVGPLTAGNGIANAAVQDLAAAGYVEAEYLVEGTAMSYRMAGPASTDGRWSVEIDDARGPGDYRTRLIVRRPREGGRFSGVLVVEWLNVSAGRDADPDWGYLHPELIREGHAWAGVSVQAVGAVGGEPLIAAFEVPGGLAGSDPERYGTVVHPGDAYAFDIYSQVSAALKSSAGRSERSPDPLDGLKPTRVVATGESQSAFFLSTYINAVHPNSAVHDAFLVHGRGATPPSIDGAFEGRMSLAPAVCLRDDLSEPVLVFETETDMTVLGYYRARQVQSERIRVWEVAGTAHADAHLIERVYAAGYDVDMRRLLGCAAPLNDGPHHEVLQAGFHHLVAWMLGGPPPAVAPSLEIEPPDRARDLGPENLPVIVRDDDGIALGGIRTPLVDVPVATLSGDPEPGGGELCFLFGSTKPFSAETIASRYKDRADYEDRFRASAQSAVASGFLLAIDAETMIARALANAPMG